YGPPELLDAGIALGDARLALGLAGVFAFSAGALRLLLRRRRLAEEQFDEVPILPHPDAAPTRAHLRSTAHGALRPHPDPTRCVFVAAVAQAEGVSPPPAARRRAG